MKGYTFFCPVCKELMLPETCPKCGPAVLLLKYVKDTDDEKPSWNKLS